MGKYLFNHEIDRYLSDYYRIIIERRILLFNFFEISRETILNLTAEIKRIWVKVPRFSIDFFEFLAEKSLALNSSEKKIPWKINIPEKRNFAVLKLLFLYRGDLNIDAI